MQENLKGAAKPMGTKRPEIGNKTSLTLYQEQGVTWSYKRYQDFREKIGTHLHTISNPKSQLGDMVPSFSTFVVLWNFGPAGLFASFLTLKQPFGHLIKALNGRYCNYESMQTNYISQFYFILSFVWQQSPNSQFCAENRYQKLHLFVVNF